MNRQAAFARVEPSKLTLVERPLDPISAVERARDSVQDERWTSDSKRWARFCVTGENLSGPVEKLKQIIRCYPKSLEEMIFETEEHETARLLTKTPEAESREEQSPKPTTTADHPPKPTLAGDLKDGENKAPPADEDAELKAAVLLAAALQDAEASSSSP